MVRLDTIAMDIGNSQTNLGGFLNDTLHWRHRFATPQAPEQWLTTLQALFSDFPETQSATWAIASVVPSAQMPLLNTLPNRPLWLSHKRLQDSSFPISLAHYAPQQLGMDRWMDLIAAWQRFANQNVVIVDCGTATTIDLLAKDGQFLGGAICPGPSAMEDSFNNRRTAQLYPVSCFESPMATPGTSTQASIANGLYYGYQGMIHHVIQTLCTEAAMQPDHILITGGWTNALAAMLLPYYPHLTEAPDLTLEGIHQAHQSILKTC